MRITLGDAVYSERKKMRKNSALKLLLPQLRLVLIRFSFVFEAFFSFAMIFSSASLLKAVDALFDEHRAMERQV